MYKFPDIKQSTEDDQLTLHLGIKPHVSLSISSEMTSAMKLICCGNFYNDHLTKSRTHNIYGHAYQTPQLSQNRNNTSIKSFHLKKWCR